MTYGAFFLVVDQNAKVRTKIVYNAPNSPYIYLNDNELLKIRMGHSDKVFALTLLPNYQFYSFKKEIQEKRISIHLITGVILSKEEDTAIHREPLKMAMEHFIPRYQEKEEVLKQILQESFIKYFDQLMNAQKLNPSEAAKAYQLLLQFDRILGLQVKEKSSQKIKIPPVIQQLVAERELKRQEKK